ncbi:NADH dehydrogenase i chain l, membrane subunit [Luminiphilus syltensis NOR5-1B]|uniref:Probable inorganic carbon transporter subunit DabB n=1 Tax=Luminiphilus syltensis NOR5-1B TaxID=565045 RepID=B8KXA5_9GAMM|nr:NADH-quinone oxidoreductase subunit L [Luminiphilus syltensis]EED35263.1 NADH dehydrogenase i chain l, membrane subunit [Luminiphilus syltensis NOR5-1B]
MPLLAILPPALIPMMWLIGGIVTRQGPDYRQPAMRQRSLCCAFSALLLSLLAVGILIATEATTPTLPGEAGQFLSLRLDAISTTMTVLISFVGLVVVRFSHNYLAGDPRQAEFIRYLCQTLAAVSLLVLAGNLILLLIAWVGMSLSLHRLLLFYPERPLARLAAKKKFWLARLGDAALGMACLQLYQRTGTIDIAEIATIASENNGLSLVAPALLLVTAALLKSAQFPTHGWITEVMEAPTPVSALLHAGIVNAGGFLILRFSGVVVSSELALYVLLLVGGVTALFGSLVMMTQRSIKSALAYSTIAQMGFMLLQCGLGAFSSAMLHIVAHSLYKAHAFLASGSIVDAARGNGFQTRAAEVRPVAVAISLIIAGGLFIGGSHLSGLTLDTKPTIVGLGAILVFATMHLLIQSNRQTRSLVLFAKAGLTASVVSGLYFMLQIGAAQIFEGAVPSEGQLLPLQFLLMLLMLVTFGAVIALQWFLPSAQASDRWRAFWVHLANGFYVNQIINHLVLPQAGDSDSRYRA